MTQDSNKIYIAGKITDLPDYIVKPKFKAAEELLIKMGYKPFNPYERLSRYKGKWNYRQFMKVCLNVLYKSDYAYFLYDWKNSPGAREELNFAIKHKIPVFNSLEDLKTYTKSGSIKTIKSARDSFLKQIINNNWSKLYEKSKKH